ncbi:hypothetical protein PVAND_014261 [Polypedilum vanderplanki]|uniref:Uncharacterized protein n=1 Tax=Polypedilum vanderplanki TaxID=319348 RepID=A0A9J6CSZ5_POLVA|nr:hypothetical protein PVAND_014261 [Polypedilum vanderplanki]
MDETEAYLRHRARVHEREKREKLKKQGKLDEYLAELEKNKPMPEPKIEKKLTEKETNELDKIMKEYLACRQFDKENEAVQNRIKIELPPDEKKNDEKTSKLNKNEVKRKFKKRKKSKKQKVEIEVEEDVLLNDVEFKPQMAGRTDLPKFFLSNLVKKNSAALQEAQARHRMTSIKTNAKTLH